MATTDTSEKGLESLIVADMTAGDWLPGDAKDYDRDYCVDVVQLRAFVEATQPKLDADRNSGADPEDADEYEAGLRHLGAQLKAGKVVVKLFLRHTLHAKLYLCFRSDHHQSRSRGPCLRLPNRKPDDRLTPS